MRRTKLKVRILSWILCVLMAFTAIPTYAAGTVSGNDVGLYEIETGITEAAQGYLHPTKIRVDADVVSHTRSEETPNEFTIVLAADTDKSAAITLDMDLVGFNESCYTGFGKFISLNGAETTGTPAESGENGVYLGTWNGSFTPEWDENGKTDATMIFNGGYRETYVFHFEIEGGGTGDGEETVAVESVTLDPSAPTVGIGATVTLNATISPDNATDKTLTWSSTDENVATVADGVVTGVAAGAATIKAETGNGVSGSCTVTVLEVEVSSVAINKESITLAPGAAANLSATVSPDDATDKTVTWSSDNTEVATVDSSTGKVSAVSVGTATITATTANGKSDTCTVNVDTGYDIVTGDVDSQGGQRMRAKNINISGVEVDRHVKTGDFSAVVILPADTDKEAEIVFTLDCVASNNITNCKVFVNNAAVGTMTADEGSGADGTWSYSFVPEWDENGKATVAFKTQWANVSWVTKTYTLELRVLGEENKAPTMKSGIENETSALIAVGESYELKLTENPIWEDYELDELSYTVSINGADPVAASSVWYQFGPEKAGDYTLVFRAKDSHGNVSEDTYTVKITAMDLTSFDIGGTAQDSWNADIKRIDMGLAEVNEVILAEEEDVYAYAILDGKTDKEDKLFFRVIGSAGRGRFFGVNINGKGVDGAQTDSTNYIWTAEYTPEWNEYGEAGLTFVAQPQNNNKYVYTIRLKIAGEENKAPIFADGGSKTDTVEQYFDYTVDVAGLFDGVDDSWLSYSVSVNDGEYEACDESFTITPHTTDTITLKFKAKDIFGAESEEYVLTLNVSEYEVKEGSFAIDRMTDNGGLLSVTIKDAEGKLIEGVDFEMTTEHNTKSFAEDSGGSFAGQTFEWDVHTIKVALPETVGVSDKVVAHWHMAQNEAGVPILSTENFYWDVHNNTKDGTATTLNGGVGSTTVYFYDKADLEYEDGEYAERYILEYYIHRENNQAPKLKEGIKSFAEVEVDQYETYSVDLSAIFEEPEGDAVTYTVKVDGETKETGKDYSLKLETDDDRVIIFKATDVMGASCQYIVDLTVNRVDRLVIETGEGAGTFKSGLNTLYVYGQPVEKYVFSKEGWNRYINVELAGTVADDAEVEIKWEGNNDSVSMSVDNPVKLVDGKAEFTVESNGHFFDRQHRYYHFVISNKPNNLPALAEGVQAEVEEERMVGVAYEVDLSTMFTDSDGDTINYMVSVNGKEAVAAEAAYSYSQSVTGDYELVFTAADAWGTSEATYTVKLKVKNSDITFDVTVKVPDAITPDFYAFGGYDENEQDTVGDELTAVKGESAKGWTSYTVAVPENLTRICFRGTDGTNTWGGMSIAVAADMEPVVLRQVQAIINTQIDSADGKVAPTAEQAVFKIKYGADGYAVNGGSFNDRYGNLGYRFLLVAADNSLIYTYYAVPLGELTGSYSTNEGNTKTITTDLSTGVTTVLPLGLKNSFTITAPAAAEVVMYRQAGYFKYNAIPVAETILNSDGTKNVVFNNVARDSIFRVSMDGEITKAGYIADGAAGITIDWEDDDRGPKYRAAYDTSTNLGARGDDSMYVNVNYRNNLQLGVNEEFQLRAYRIWEIINYDTTNIMIEPDFHYNIISGSDVIDIAPTDDADGIAGQSWLDITAKKAGTAIIEVSYDAIHIVSGSKNGDDFIVSTNNFTFNASDPARTALVVVQVGSAKNDINFGFELNRADGWDVEFDTLYFTGDKGQIRFQPTVITGGEIAKVEVSGDKGVTYTTLTAGEDGFYTADIVSGNNIIRVTKADGSEHYQVVRGDKVTLTVTEVAGASDQDGIYEAGEKINVKFNGVHNVIGKMSGIYNPTDYKTNFTYNGETVSGSGGQYTYPHAAYVVFTIPGNAADGTSFTLTNGNTTNGGWGSAGGAHRAVTGEVAPGLNADTVTNNGRNIFPDITVTVGTEIVTADPVDPSMPDAPDTPDTPDVPDTPDIPDIPDDPDATLDFGLDESEIEGYVTISFVDRGQRKAEELEEIDEQFRNPLGTIISATQVPFKAYDTIASVTLRLLEAMRISAVYNGDEYSGFYLAAINNFTVNETRYESFGEFDAGAQSGWMITWDDWFINKGASEFMVDDGDVISWKYTCQLGADIGDDYSSEAVDEVEALIDAIGTPVTLESEEAIRAARTAFSLLTSVQQSEVKNIDVLTAAEEALAALKAESGDQVNIDHKKVYDETGDYLEALGKQYEIVVNSIGGEWMVIGLARGDQEVAKDYFDEYYANVLEYVKENINDKEQLHRSKSTENARVILALTALGKDVTDVDGHNLLAGLTDMKYVKKQGINGPIWALIAFDSHDYEIPTGGDVTREALIDTILAAQKADGGWTLSGDVADADMTGMALQALAPYNNSNDEVKDAVDKALAYLSESQNADGSFSSVDGPNSESTSQVIVALTALGINPETDERFVKNGLSVVDALCGYAVEGGGFMHVADDQVDGMSTEQGYYALVAYYRFLNGKNSLYDMSDVTLKTDTSSGNGTTESEQAKKDQVAAEKVEDLIDAIGTVTVNSESKIKAARAAYDKLTAAQKKLVDNYSKLTAAEAAFDVEKANYVEGLIDAIGTVTVNSASRIAKARVAYYNLTDAQKKLVDNYEYLLYAEDKLEEVRVEYVEDLIDSIGTVTKNSKTKIDRARTAYNNLSDSNKEKVSNLNVLLEAEAAYAKLAKTSTTKKTTTKTTTGSANTAEADMEDLTKFAEKVKEQIEGITKDALAGEMLDAILAYEDLTEEEKAAIDKEWSIENFKERIAGELQIDSKTGIGVSGAEWNIQIVVDDVLDVTEIQYMQEKLGGNTMLGLWDIYLEDVLTGKEVQPDGSILVKIPLASLGDYAAYDGLTVVHYAEDGTVEYLNSTLIGDCIAFNATEFSYYAVAGYMGASPLDNLTDDVISDDVKTDSSTPVLPWIIGGGCGLALLAVLLFLIMKNKKVQAGN